MDEERTLELISEASERIIRDLGTEVFGTSKEDLIKVIDLLEKPITKGHVDKLKDKIWESIRRIDIRSDDLWGINAEWENEN